MEDTPWRSNSGAANITRRGKRVHGAEARVTLHPCRVVTGDKEDSRGNQLIAAAIPFLLFLSVISFHPLPNPQHPDSIPSACWFNEAGAERNRKEFRWLEAR